MPTSAVESSSAISNKEIYDLNLSNSLNFLCHIHSGSASRQEITPRPVQTNSNQFESIQIGSSAHMRLLSRGGRRHLHIGRNARQRSNIRPVGLKVEVYVEGSRSSFCPPLLSSRVQPIRTRKFTI